jgi:hypothetical protein
MLTTLAVLWFTGFWRYCLDENHRPDNVALIAALVSSPLLAREYRSREVHGNSSVYTRAHRPGERPAAVLVTGRITSCRSPAAAPVERWSIDRLIPYAKNARTHSDAQIAAHSDAQIAAKASCRSYAGSAFDGNQRRPPLSCAEGDRARHRVTRCGRASARREPSWSEFGCLATRGASDAISGSC